MDATQHDRGWDLSVNDGIDQRRAQRSSAEGTAKPKKNQKKDAKEDEKKDPKENPKKKTEAAKVVVPKDLTPMRAIKVSTWQPLPTDGHWDHVFFTYDGSGKAAGVKIYVNGDHALPPRSSPTRSPATACGPRLRCSWDANRRMRNLPATRATRIFASMGGH